MSLDKHLRRLMRSAKALGFKNVHTREQVTEAIFQTLAANGMRNDAHMRLTLTRGEKCTSSMNPAFNVYGTTLIILAEWKPTEVSDNNLVFYCRSKCTRPDDMIYNFACRAQNSLFLVNIR
jgi:branched-subunit amino acid aminotransferase/4-amino-4-deoxychorismate lyase